MFSSTKLGRFGGIDVFIHSTFYLLIGWIIVMHWMSGESVGAMISGVVFVLLIFLCVVLHEFGHALTARKFGIQTRDITLYPIGGVARLEKMPEDPMEELWVALAGPAVNVVIAALLFAYLYLTRTFIPVEQLGIAKGSLVERIMVVNVILVVFNMLPAFPMDGGRVLRAVLANNMDYVHATRIAANTGKAMALLFGFIGLLVNPLLLFIAFFVWIGASGEAGQVQMRRLLHGVPVSDVMIRDFDQIQSTAALSELQDYMLRGSQRSFPVLDEQDEFVGMVTEQDLIKGLQEKQQDKKVEDIMKTSVEKLDSLAMVDVSMQSLLEAGQTAAPVMEGDDIVGLFTLEHLQNYLSFRSIQPSSSGVNHPS